MVFFWVFCIGFIRVRQKRSDLLVTWSRTWKAASVSWNIDLIALFDVGLYADTKKLQSPLEFCVQTNITERKLQFRRDMGEEEPVLSYKYPEILHLFLERLTTLSSTRESSQLRSWFDDVHYCFQYSDSWTLLAKIFFLSCGMSTICSSDPLRSYFW